MEVVQRDANILWWSRDPTLELLEGQDGTASKNMKRVRRWVAKNTAIGPREWGGLNNMDWADHVSAFKAQWIVRYLDPNESSWKDIIDEYILKDSKGRLKYPEGRGIVMQKLSVREKAAILANFPKKASTSKLACENSGSLAYNQQIGWREWPRNRRGMAPLGSPQRPTTYGLTRNIHSKSRDLRTS